MPLELVPNKVPRYPGGREIDRFGDWKSAMMTEGPRHGVGSTTRALGPHEDKNTGLSEVGLPSGEVTLLTELIDKYPKRVTGRKALRKIRFGTLYSGEIVGCQESAGLTDSPHQGVCQSSFWLRFR